jgi:DNA-binding MltR family transcriptional regulator
MVDIDISTAVKNVFEGIRHQSRMTHSGVVLASAAILDSQLERALKKAMKPLPKKLYERLFESFGPLSTFSSKIIMARALGIVTIEIYGELEKIRQIRNAFAHSSTILNFESEEIAPRFLSLRKRHTTKTTHSELFVDCVRVIDDSLKAYLAQSREPLGREKRDMVES